MGKEEVLQGVLCHVFSTLILSKITSEEVTEFSKIFRMSTLGVPGGQPSVIVSIRFEWCIWNCSVNAAISVCVWKLREKIIDWGH